jgi:gliding motility-associated-like protein
MYSVQLIVTSNAGCSDTIAVSNLITVSPVPVAGFTHSPDQATTLTSLVQFQDTSLNAVAWLWNFGDLPGSMSTDQHPSFLYNGEGCYPVTLVVSNAAGCSDTAEQMICINPEITIYVPNAFTPNANGMNDIFLPAGTGISESGYRLMIFDRWGNLVFETTDLHQGWDGRIKGQSDIAQMDTYVWKLKAVDVTGVEHDMIGHVNLIR